MGIPSILPLSRLRFCHHRLRFSPLQFPRVATSSPVSLCGPPQASCLLLLFPIWLKSGAELPWQRRQGRFDQGCGANGDCGCWSPGGRGVMCDAPPGTSTWDEAAESIWSQEGNSPQAGSSGPICCANCLTELQGRCPGLGCGLITQSAAEVFEGWGRGGVAPLPPSLPPAWLMDDTRYDRSGTPVLQAGQMLQAVQPVGDTSQLLPSHL